MAAIADFMTQACSVWSLGYDQGNRWDIRDGGETDCSALAAWCAWKAGYTDDPKPRNIYTGNIVPWLKSHGFYEVPLSQRKRNDIVVSVGNHAAVMLSHDRLGQASRDERGQYRGGLTGDQDGGETAERSYYNYPWTNCLRAPDGTGNGKGSGPIPSATDHPRDGQKGSGVIYQVHTREDGWLEPVRKVDDSDEGFAGNTLHKIDGIKARRADGGRVTIQAHMIRGGLMGETVFTDSLFGSNPDGDGYSGDIDSGDSIDYLIVRGCKVRVAADASGYFGWCDENGGNSDGDGYAGDEGTPIVCVQMKA